MASIAKFINLRSTDEAMTDREDMPAQEQVVPHEVRAARRSAAAALAASMLTFALVSCVAVRIFVFDSAAMQSAAATATEALSTVQAKAHTASSSAKHSGIVGLSEVGYSPKLGTFGPRLGLSDGPATSAVSGEFASSSSAAFPSPHLMEADGVVYKDKSKGSVKVRDLPKGRKVFPLKREGDWVEVVIPREGDEPPSMGWLAASKAGGGEVLRRQPMKEIKAQHDAERAEIKPMTQEEVHKKWAEVREKNNELKAQLVDFQASMRNHYISSLRNEKDKAGKAAIQGVKEMVDTEAVKDDVQKLKHEIQELKSDPKDFLRDIGKALK